MDDVVRQVLETQHGLKLIRRIGRGGFAEVWQARTAQDVPCAIKVSLDPLDAQNPAIQKELENLQLLKALVGHPHVVTLMDVWLVGGYLVTRWEFSSEGSLEDRLKQYQAQGQQGIPVQELLRYIYDAAQGIDFLNDQGIVHRDIKPQNLLLFFNRVKVADLGLAKLIGASTRSHTGAGTWGYLPPEAYRGRLTPTVDLYSLAATYVKLRTGKEPFGAEPGEILDRQRAGLPMVENLGEQERLVVVQALSADPAARPQQGACAWVRSLYNALQKPKQPAGQAPKRPESLLEILPISSSPPSHQESERYHLRDLSEAVPPWPTPPRAKTADAPILAKKVEESASSGVFTPTLSQAPPPPAHRLHPEPSPPEAPPSSRSLQELFSKISPSKLTLWVGVGLAISILFLFFILLGQGRRTPSQPTVNTITPPTPPTREAATGQEPRTFQGHTDSVWSVAFSPDERLLATASHDGTAKLWEAATGRELRTLKGHTSWVRSVAFSPDGRLLATGSDDGTAKLWDVATGRELRTLKRHTNPVTSVAFSWNGRLLATGSRDGTVKLWQVR